MIVIKKKKTTKNNPTTTQEQRLQRSIFAIQDFFTVTPLTWLTSMHIWVASRNIVTEWLHKFQLSRDPVNLSEHQGYSSWNQTIDFNCLESHQVWNKSVHNYPHSGRCYTYIPLNTIRKRRRRRRKKRKKKKRKEKKKKNRRQSSLPRILLVQNEFSMNFIKPTGCGIILNYIQISRDLQENGHILKKNLIQLWLLVYAWLGVNY